MDARKLIKLRTDLTAFLDAVAQPLGHPRRRKWCDAYLRGILLDGHRKSVEPMAARLKAVEQGLARESARRAAASVVPPASSFAAVVTTVGDSALVPAVPPLPAADLGPQSTQSFDLDRPLRDARDGFEKAYFEFHLAMENGSMTRVAEKTGLERTHLYRKLKQLGVDLSRGRRSAV